jgi:molybdopterin molybdotransferase
VRRGQNGPISPTGTVGADAPIALLVAAQKAGYDAAKHPNDRMGGNVSATEPSRSSWKDVRMRGFQDRADVGEVLALLLSRVHPLPAEPVALVEAAGRVLAATVTAPVDVPAFNRSAMDGYALRGSETFGAGPYNPLEFRIVGEVLPGRDPGVAVEPGQAVRIMTGAPLPPGADAVLPVESAEETLASAGPALRVTEPVPPGRNVGHRGEDIEAGTVVLSTGRRLRPQDVGVLASLGANPVAVVRRPTVAILVTGDELLPCGARPEGFRIVDSNSVMLAALAARDGALPAVAPLLPDCRDAVRQALHETVADIVFVSGGSSVGLEDHAPRVLAELGDLCVHGVALRPASPAGFGFLPGAPPRPVFLMPGNPVSCLCAYDLFAGPAVRCLGGRPPESPGPRVSLPLARKISSPVGRVDYVRVSIRDGRVEPLATSGASILSSTTRADGYVLVPRDSEGFAPGEIVVVHLYDF